MKIYSQENPVTKKDKESIMVFLSADEGVIILEAVSNLVKSSRKKLPKKMLKQMETELAIY